MSKFSEAEELAAIQEIEDGESIRSVAKKKGMDKTGLLYKYNMYKEHGQIRPRGYRYNWTAEEKYQILEYMHSNHLSCKQTGIQFGINGASTVWQWEQRYLKNGIDGLEDKNKNRKPVPKKNKPQKTKNREEELLDRILYLEAENAYLKKLNALVAEREKKERENK